MIKYIWQNNSWTNFTWESEKLVSSLSNAKKAQGYILGQADFFELRYLGEIIAEEAYTTSAIEGENLDKDAIRSSVAKRLGLPTAGLTKETRNSDGLVELLIDAIRGHDKRLTKERIWGWQASLFPTGFSGIHKISVGEWRKGDTPMQVISGPMGKEKVHFEAPPSTSVEKEMIKFLDWWNTPPDELDGLIRAAIAHLWFVTIHPFDDGNGRIARAITDMALAQDEKINKRLYSLSSQIIKDKKNYYDILEKTQKGQGDITEWINWFLDMFYRSIENSKSKIEKSLYIGKFYKFYAQVELNERQKKVIQRLLDCLPEDFRGGLTNKNYVAMTKISPGTAKRDLADLVNKSILIPNEGKGRSVSYRLNRKI